MSLKKILFIVHDPGGYSVVYPLFERLQQTIECEMFCLGPSAELNHALAESEDNITIKLIEYLKKRDISLLVTGTSWGNDFELRSMDLCNRFSVPTIAVLDYWSSYMERFQMSNGSTILPSFFVVMDHIAFKEALDDGIPEKMIKVLGHPGLDQLINKREKSFTLDQSDYVKRILFISQPLHESYGRSLGYDEEEVLTDCINALKSMNRATLKVKFHLKDNQVFKNKFIDLAAEGNLIELLKDYDIVIGMNSIALLQAVLLNKITISYQPNLLKEDLCITNKLGLTHLIVSFNDLLRVMENDKSIPNIQHIKIDSYKDDLVWLDGKSTERVLNFLQEVALDDEY